MIDRREETDDGFFCGFDALWVDTLVKDGISDRWCISVSCGDKSYHFMPFVSLLGRQPSCERTRHGVQSQGQKVEDTLT